MIKMTSRAFKYFLFFVLPLSLWRCSVYNFDLYDNLPCDSFAVSINFSQLQVYESGVLTYTQSMAGAAVRYYDGQCQYDIIYFSGINSAQIKNIMLYYQTDTSNYRDVVLNLQDQSKVSLSIDGSFDTFTEMSGGHYRIVPVRP